MLTGPLLALLLPREKNNIYRKSSLYDGFFQTLLAILDVTCVNWKQEKKMKKLEDYVRTIPDFPKEGILFRDITSVLQDKEGLHLAIDTMEKIIKDMEPTVIAGAEARGFLLGMPVAYNLSLPFVPVRKKGKLPCETVSESYDLEYGSAEIEIDKTAIKKGDRVVLVDDLIATGGTMKAAIALIERLGGEVAGIAALIELVDLRGREILSPYRVESVIQYEGD